MSGYARFHRSLIGHPAFRNDAEAMAFAYMVLRAAWKPVRVRYKGKALSLERGQLAMSVRDLADAMDRDKGWVERLLKRLKAETMCETLSDTGVLVITICNYEKYQAVGEARETLGETVDETPARQTQDTEQEDKKPKKEEKKEPRKRERTPDFEVPDWIPAVPWSAFCAMRKSKGKPVDSYIADRLFGRLETIRADGWDLAKVLDKATVNFWIDVYKPTPGRDDDLRANGSGTPAKPFDLEEYRARMARLEAGGFTPDARVAEPERRNNGPPRPIGQLVAGIAGSVQH
jgi:hypothetical protein